MWAPAGNSSPQARIGVLIFTLVPLYYFSYRLHPTFSQGNGTIDLPQPLSPAEWQKQWLNTDLLQPFSPEAIQGKCNETEWNSNLVFNLADANGGIGNVRANMLDFFFYAIEMGASIVLPGMAVRRDDNLFDVWGAGRANFSYMFDEAWFKQSITEACPQMTVHEPFGDVEAVWTNVGEMYNPRIPRARKDSSKEEWAQQTASWLAAHGVGDDTPTIVNLERTMWETNTRGEREEFRLALGMLLRVREDVRQHAATAMYHLATKHGIEMLPWANLHPRAYYGAHLRTESDTIDAGWFAPPSSTEVGLNFEAQTDRYMEAAMEHDLSVIFAASGNSSEIERFKAKAALHRPPLTVLSKWDLLSTEDGDALRSMHWDQQALVDLEILKRCSVFGGMAKSSFAFHLATARTAWMEQHKMVQDPWFAPHGDAMVSFENKLNKIWGRNEVNEARVPKGDWP